MDHRSALNGLRAVAALIVVAYHFRYFSHFPWLAAFPPLRLGYLGVDFFFVLSGLIITHVYAASIISGREVLRRFVFLRLARILPVHALIMVVMLICSVVVAKTLSQKDLVDWVSLTLLVRQWTLPDGYAWNSPAWSVSAEMFAYCFIFPLTLALTRASPSGAGVRLLTGGVLILGLLIFQNGSINDTSGVGPLLRVTSGFLIGAGLFHLLAKRARSTEWRVGIWGGLLIVVFGLVLLAEVVVFLGLIALTISAYMVTGRLERHLSSRPIYLIGEWSFSLYLSHVPMFMLASWLASRWQIDKGVGFSLTVLAASIAMSGILFHLFETPCRRRMRQWYDGRGAEAPRLGKPGQHPA